MGKKKLSSKLKEVLVDEEVSLSVIENREFVAMRAAEKLWPVSTTTEDQLCDMVSDGLIQEKDFAN
jgi:reverse gyrase